MESKTAFFLSLAKKGGRAHFFLIAKQPHPAWTLYSKGRVIAIPFSEQRTPVDSFNPWLSYQLWRRCQRVVTKLH